MSPMGRRAKRQMMIRRVFLGLGAIAASYVLVFALFVFLMSLAATGDPQQDGRNASLAAINLVGKFALAGVVGFAGGVMWGKTGWWLGAVVMASLIVLASTFFPRSFLLSMFGGDDIIFNAAFVVVALVMAKLGELVMARRSATR